MDEITTITPNKAFLITLGRIIAAFLLITVFVFAAAGRLDWVLGWFFAVFWLLLKVGFLVILRWHDPDLMVERATRHENTQSYDRVIIPIYFCFSFATIFVAALDGGRFKWSGEVSLSLIAFSYFLSLLGNGLASWAVASNPYFSSESRLQQDRNQTVTQRGPYRFVRHPAYLASVIMWLVTGLNLGSWYAAIPGLFASLAMFVRTYYEDRMLHAELAGYAAYAKQVRYRLFPRIW